MPSDRFPALFGAFLDFSRFLVSPGFRDFWPAGAAAAGAAAAGNPGPVGAGDVRAY